MYVHVYCCYSRYLGFAGCIRDFEVADSISFDLTKADVRGSNETRGSCYDKAQPGLGFNGSAWARFGKRGSSKPCKLMGNNCQFFSVLSGQVLLNDLDCCLQFRVALD